MTDKKASGILFNPSANMSHTQMAEIERVKAFAVLDEDSKVTMGAGARGKHDLYVNKDKLVAGAHNFHDLFFNAYDITESSKKRSI